MGVMFFRMKPQLVANVSIWLPTKEQRGVERWKKKQISTFAIVAPLVIQDEIWMKEKNMFVGATAGFNDMGEIIPRCNDRLPKGSY